MQTIFLAFASRVCFTLGKSRQPNMPNAENCSLAELETAAGPTVSLTSHVRIMAIKALLLGITHDQVAKLYETTRRNLSRWIDRFNRSGIDGLIQRPRPGRPRKITHDKREEYIALIYSAAQLESV